MFGGGERRKQRENILFFYLTFGAFYRTTINQLAGNPIKKQKTKRNWAGSSFLFLFDSLFNVFFFEKCISSAS